MRVVKVKICGITNIEDAFDAVELGADLLGFNFYPKSPRYIDPDRTLAIIDHLPTYIDTVGVFVNPTVEEMKDMVERSFLNWVQLHGDESPEFCESLDWIGARIIKAIRVKSAEQIDDVQQYFTDAVLLDAFDREKYGGTGKTFDWSIIGDLHKRVFLAGGINPDNAVKAIEVGVYGIDVCSGVESSPGKKDHEKMKSLFENIEHVRG